MLRYETTTVTEREYEPDAPASLYAACAVAVLAWALWPEIFETCKLILWGLTQ